MPDPADPPIDPSPEFHMEPVAPGISGKISGWAASALTALLRFAFHLLYHQLAFSYDAVAWIVSAGEWADWRRCVIPYLPPGRVLEIAHGTGTLSLDMAAGGHPVTGIDLSGAMGKIARAKILRRRRSAADIGSAGDPALVQADVQLLPFQSGVFAAATATFPADFLFQRSTFRAVHRALRPGGIWIILPTAFPEGFAKRWLPDEETISSGGIWRRLIRNMEACGFRVRMEIVRRPRSRVLLILAEKQ
ncbi:MAG: class I SAM-dependent methyltransferase [Anaerolineales bacterium]